MTLPNTPNSRDDARWMRYALEIAHQMRGHVWPNPPVGCVIVKDGLVIEKGATQPRGRLHGHVV